MAGKTLQFTEETIKFLKENPDHIVHTNSQEIADILNAQFPTVQVHLYIKHKPIETIFWNFGNGISYWMIKNEVEKIKGEG